MTPPDPPPDGHTSRRYHRLSAYTYDPDDLWPRPIDHPLVRQDFSPNHLPTFPTAWNTWADSPRREATPGVRGIPAPSRDR